MLYRKLFWCEFINLHTFHHVWNNVRTLKLTRNNFLPQTNFSLRAINATYSMLNSKHDLVNLAKYINCIEIRVNLRN